MKQVLYSSLAIVLILFGLIILPLPIPFGALMLITGLAILIAHSVRAAEFVRRQRIQCPKLNDFIVSGFRVLPAWITHRLRRTDP